VTVKAYVERIDIVLGREVLASHPRSYGRHEQILDPVHYLDRLDRRPAALDHANVFRRWQLPAVFDELRKALERQHGPSHGAKHYVRVIQLLQAHAQEQVLRAIEQSRTEAGFDVEAILQRVRQQSGGCVAVPPLDLAQQPAAVRALQVPPPDLSKFNQFLSTVENTYDRCEYSVTESQPETTAAADDARRVRGPGPRGGDSQRELPAIPAPPDGTGGDGAGRERAQGAHQAGHLPSAQGFRQLRLHRPTVVAQAEGWRAAIGSSNITISVL
jgi:hypothetical protein